MLGPVPEIVHVNFLLADLRDTRVTLARETLYAIGTREASCEVDKTRRGLGAICVVGPNIQCMTCPRHL